MPQRPILVTGCQRSGTTLMRLVLDSHPDIYSIDEDKFECWFLNSYLNSPGRASHVLFKLPRYAPALSFVGNLPDARVVWCVRDPLDVVLSMINLQIPLGRNISVSWAAHPYCAVTEIMNSYWALDAEVRRSLDQQIDRLQEISDRKPAERTRQENIYTGALCWMVKNSLPAVYRQRGIDYLPVNYEAFVSSPGGEIRRILAYTGLEWHEDVMRHHELHDGVSIGGTVNRRSIDSSSVGRGMANFTADESALVMEVCGDVAREWGYVR